MLSPNRLWVLMGGLYLLTKIVECKALGCCRGNSSYFLGFIEELVIIFLLKLFLITVLNIIL
jgi:hypothetical protein